MWIYYPVAPSIGPATSRLQAQSVTAEHWSRLVCATPNIRQSQGTSIRGAFEFLEGAQITSQFPSQKLFTVLFIVWFLNIYMHTHSSFLLFMYACILRFVCVFRSNIKADEFIPYPLVKMSLADLPRSTYVGGTAIVWNTRRSARGHI